MNTTIEVYLGAPIEIESERRFLSNLCADLKARGLSALILANFQLPAHKPIHQIDFLVILDREVCHVELKNLTAPASGKANGLWYLQLPDGSKKSLHGNPYRQSLECKYAISDQMHRSAKRVVALSEPASGKKFYRQFDSVVCVFPDLMSGSDVPSDNRVRVLGYPALLEQLTTRDCRPSWSRHDWTTFAMELGLVREEEFSEPAPDSVAGRRELVESYIERFRDYYGPMVVDLVPTTIDANDEKKKSGEHTDFFASARHGQLIGPSGSGKTIHVQAMAMEALEQGRVPVVARAIDYAGRLSSLLDRSVAHLCPRTANEFISAVRNLGKALTLVIDGYNECPARLKDRLVQDLQAAYLRWEIPIVITTQETISLPNNLTGDILQFCELDDEERVAVLAKHAKEALPPGCNELCRPFRTAYELSIAASCLAELGSVATRARLFEAYVRRRCAGSVDLTLARRVLSEAADALRLGIRSTLPIDELWRIGEKVLDDQNAPLTMLQEVIDCGLVEVRQGQCTFRHELLQRYFETVALVRVATDLGHLTELLSKPAHHSLIEFALGIQTQISGVRAVLQAAAQANSVSGLFAECLQGRFGGTARETVAGDAVKLPKDAEEELLELEVGLSESKFHPGHFAIEVGNGREWSSYEKALVGAVSETFSSGLFFEEVLYLLDETEQRCMELLEGQLGSEQARRASARSNLFSEAFVLGKASQYLPASIILRGIDGRIRRTLSETVIDRIKLRLGEISTLSPAQIYFLLSFLRYDAIPEERDIAEIVRYCWNSGIYHLRLKMLDCVGNWGGRWSEDGHLSEGSRKEVAEALSNLETSNVMLSTQLVETMMVYDLIEPPVDVQQLDQQLADIVAHPDDPEAQSAASDVVSNMFEIVFDDLFYQAIEKLSPADRITLFTMAALGAPSYSMSADYSLSKLLEVDDQRTLPAFERFARELDDAAVCAQDVAKCFVLGHMGCARYLDSPRQLEDLSTEDRLAWQCYGEIIFWLHKPGLPDKEVIRRCEPLWNSLRADLAFEAVDPLQRLAQANDMDPNRPNDPIQAVLGKFREIVREILEYGIKHRDRLTALDRRFPGDGITRELTTFLIHTLGQIGGPETVSLLSPFVEDEYHGPDAVEAIRRLNSGEQGNRITVIHRFP